MKKIILIIAILAILISAFCITSFASEAAEGGEISGEICDTGEENLNTNDASPTEESDENAFSAAYTLIMDNLDKILAAASAICAFILAFAYKRGLLPLIKNALAKLGKETESIGEKAKSYSEGAELMIREINEKISAGERMIEGFIEKAEAIERSLGDAEENRRQREILNAAMCAELDMLYEIFMTSSLPQYQKDRMGESFAKIKAGISGGE